MKHIHTFYSKIQRLHAERWTRAIQPPPYASEEMKEIAAKSAKAPKCHYCKSGLG